MDFWDMFDGPAGNALQLAWAAAFAYGHAIVEIDHLLFGIVYERYMLVQPSHNKHSTTFVEPVQLGADTLTSKQQRRRLRRMVDQCTQRFSEMTTPSHASTKIVLGTSAQAALRTAWQSASTRRSSIAAKATPPIEWQGERIPLSAMMSLADLLYGITGTVSEHPHLVAMLAQELAFLEAMLDVTPLQLMRCR